VADPDHDTTIKTALAFSRMAVQKSLSRLSGLRDKIVLINKLDGPSKIAEIQRMVTVFSRDIAVISQRLLVSSDPLSKEFRDALDSAIDLIRQNQNPPVRSLMKASPAGAIRRILIRRERLLPRIPRLIPIRESVYATRSSRRIRASAPWQTCSGM
jgi:hypothetical protein